MPLSNIYLEQTFPKANSLAKFKCFFFYLMDNYYGMKQNYLHVTLHPTHYTTKNILKYVEWCPCSHIFSDTSNYSSKILILREKLQFCYRFLRFVLSLSGKRFLNMEFTLLLAKLSATDLSRATNQIKRWPYFFYSF